MEITRLAPSPTGALHLGNARTFLINWLLARQNGWRIVLRIEDLDGPRVKAGADRQAIEDLRWLGIDWDDGPIYQAERFKIYRSAAEKLLKDRHAYPCVCSRREAVLAASAPNAEDGAAVYPGTCRERFSSVHEARSLAGKEPAIRFQVPTLPIEFNDAFRGAILFENPAKELGDFVIFKNDGTAAYQLAVVVDDAEQGITQVVRGDDLVDSTPRQMMLYRALGLSQSIPKFTHLPLVVGRDGRRLAKRHGDTRISLFRESGVPAGRVRALLARWCGIEAGPSIEIDELKSRFKLAQVPRQRIMMKNDDVPKLEQYHRDVIAGQQRGAVAGLLRGALAVAEPFYSGVVSIRNTMFGGLRTPVRVDRPVISVGNITTGGTGKTPVVRWLVDGLIARGQKPAILTRGYRGGDEQRMLQSQLPATLIEANPSRVEGARRVLTADPSVTAFVLDDGFQHRQLARDFDLVLIDASNPFGFDHVLPRGLLREPLSGLARADALLVTRYEPAAITRIEPELRRHNAAAPIVRCRHVHCGFREMDGGLNAIEALRGVAVASVSAIGNPQSFEDQLRSHGASIAANIRFPDHHRYTRAEVLTIQKRAAEAGARMVVTTEKDWVKLAPLIDETTSNVAWCRVGLRIAFEADDESRLLDAISAVLKPSSAPARAATR